MTSILITGGVGYFGRAFVQHCIEDTQYERVCVYSRDEFKQHQLRDLAHFYKNAAPTGMTRDRMRYFIGDVRDLPRLTRAMEGIDIVVHAAALKRVEVGEYNPDEMVKTNIVGAMNVIEAARTQHVGKVIMLSTDKACMPTNAYGASKMMAEKLFLAANENSGSTGPRFAVTRYGNVAGSTGSVIPTWREKIAKGAVAVPVTDPRCTRFWMDIGHAVGLVQWTIDHMEGGELVVPCLPAYRLCDLAEAMGLQSYQVGLGQGEKPDESMVGPYESEGFRYVEPQLVKGGIGERGKPIAEINTRMLTVAELRELLVTV